MRATTWDVAAVARSTPSSASFAIACDYTAAARRVPSGEGAAELDEQRLEGERRRELELLEAAPGLAHELGGELRALEPLEAAVLPQLFGPVDVDERLLGPRRRGDEVAVPRRELLQRGKQLLALGASARPADPLLRLSRGQVEPLE